MTPDEFADITQKVIAEIGMGEMHPTVLYPKLRRTRSLADFNAYVTTPEGEARIVEWATKSVRPDEEYLVAFKVDAKHFKVIHGTGPVQTEAKVYEVK